MQKRWTIRGKNVDEVQCRLLAESLGIEMTLARLLLLREIQTFDQARAFFRPTMDMLHDPFLMKDMDKAMERIEKAILNHEKVLVYGDYDVDGTTAVSLVYSFLKNFFPENHIDYYIPDRYKEGYGISFAGIDYAEEHSFSLIIALDCGIKSNDKVTYASAKHIDFIICDHHRPGDTIPDAVAVLDPKRSDCVYPYKELTGAGIGFKLLQAWCLHNHLPQDDLYLLLDLVVVSIAADIVPIDGENRVLAYFGLQRLNQHPGKGLKAILEVAQVKRELSVMDIVFVIGPRINAAGRLETGKKAVQLLLSETEEIALETGKSIQKTNTDRQQLDKVITAEALQMIEDKGWQNRKSSVLFHPEWHKGVIGIVASRLTEKYYRPTIMLTQSNGMVTGSARSVKDFDVYEAIEACADLLIQFGGHKYAAGLTLQPENVEAFVEKFEVIVSSTIKEELLIPEVEIDDILDFKDIQPKFFRIIKQFAPFGPGNLSPVFCTGNVKVLGTARVVGETHLRMDLFQESNPKLIFPSIAFGLASKLDLVNSGVPLSVAYSIEENEWNGVKSIQLSIKDIAEM